MLEGCKREGRVCEREGRVCEREGWCVRGKGV